MENNAQQNGAVAPTDNVVTFPGSDETNLQDISTLLGGAPVLQQEPAANASPLTQGAIASKADFEAVEEARPFAHKIAPKTVARAALAGLIILPLSVFLIGGGSKSNNEQTVAEVVPAGEAGSSYVSPDDMAAMQAELEQLRSQQAFIDQQVDAEAIDAMGKQKAAATAKSQTQPPSAAKPAPVAKPSTVSSRPAQTPTPSRVVTPAPPRSTPAATAPRSSAPITQAPTRQIVAQPPEPVDPFERRAQLQALGTYGAPPPTAQAVTRSASDEASNPFESPYIQAIAVETPQAQPAIARAPAEEIAPTQRAPLTEEEMLYEQDAAAVLAATPTEAPEAEIESYQTERSRPAIERDDAAVLDPRRFAREQNEPVLKASRPQPSAASPMAIMPGTSTEAELPYGFSWQEGTPLPEVLMTTTEDIMADELAVIPAGTQLLGQAQIDPSSGTVTIQVVSLFGETRDVQIPRSSVVVQATDGSVLTADASGGGSRTSSGSGVGGFLMESLANGVGNVIDSDDSLVGDLAGGVAETVIDGQVRRSQATTAARNSRRAAAPIVWTLSARPVQLTFNNYIPLYSEQR